MTAVNFSSCLRRVAADSLVYHVEEHPSGSVTPCRPGSSPGCRRSDEGDQQTGQEKYRPLKSTITRRSSWAQHFTGITDTHLAFIVIISFFIFTLIIYFSCSAATFCSQRARYHRGVWPSDSGGHLSLQRRPFRGRRKSCCVSSCPQFRPACLH